MTMQTALTSAEISPPSTAEILTNGEGFGARTPGAEAIPLSSETGTHAAALQGRPVHDPSVQRGPFAMSTAQDLDAVAAAYAAGKLGTIA